MEAVAATQGSFKVASLPNVLTYARILAVPAVVFACS